jgi:hypothetical protein
MTIRRFFPPKSRPGFLAMSRLFEKPARLFEKFAYLLSGAE